jgi:hypothetical protein
MLQLPQSPFNALEPCVCVQEWTGEACIGDALVELAARLPRARLLITTQGSKGSICLLRQQPDQQATSEHCLQELVDDLFSQVDSSSGNGGSSSSPVCVSSGGLHIHPARVAASPAAVRLRRSGSRDVAAAAVAAQQAAAQAAALNADAGNAGGYAGGPASAAAAAVAPADAALTAQVFVASAAGLPAGAVADTTGAGDAFIGSVLYSLTTGLQPQQMMRLGAAVAACKCTALGARPGLPSRRQLSAEVL